MDDDMFRIPPSVMILWCEMMSRGIVERKIRTRIAEPVQTIEVLWRFCGGVIPNLPQ
jgi:hypothetical protein